MNLIDVRAQLESDLAWRQNEIRLLRNLLSTLTKEEDKKRYRKALVVMLYSHYEGFCKTAFLTYIAAINQENIPCFKANNYIKVASLSDIFDALETRDSKCKTFKPRLPDDSKLHRYCRHVDFISELDRFMNRRIYIPDKLIDTESNLKREVLRKLLYRLGFPYDIFVNHEGKIECLLNIRNEIAHGRYSIKGIEQDQYESLEKAIYEVMTGLIKILMNSLESQSYLIIQ